jgi:S1-C subfamily serine protease
VRNIADEGEMSAFGLPGVTGVLVLEVPTNSLLSHAGLQKNDVILSVNGNKTTDAAILLRQRMSLIAGQSFKISISRNQQEMVLTFRP